jgi:5-methylcytosine-specific restriction protein B
MSKVIWEDVKEQVNQILKVTGYPVTWIESIFEKSENLDFDEWTKYETETEKIEVFTRIIALILFYLRFSSLSESTSFESLYSCIEFDNSFQNIYIYFLNKFFDVDIDQIKEFYQEKFEIAIDDINLREEIEEINLEAISSILSTIFATLGDLFKSLLDKYFDDIDQLISTNQEEWDLITILVDLRYFDRKNLIDLTSFYKDKTSNFSDKVNIDSPFSEISFSLLGEIEFHKNNPHNIFQSKLEEIETYIEKPLQRIFEEVFAQIPDYFLNIFNVDAQVYHYEDNERYLGCIYSWNCESIDDAKLFIIISSDQLFYGFFAPVESKPRQKFIYNCKSNINAIKSNINLVKAISLCQFHGKNPNLKRNKSFTLEDWFKNSCKRNIEYKHIQCSEHLKKDTVLSFSEEELIQKISSFFENILSLTILAFSDDPIPLINKYCKPNRQIRVDLDNATKFKRQNDVTPINKKLSISKLIDYTDTNFLQDTSITPEELNRYEKTIKRKKQIILAGSPGTGKTFIAQKFAKYLTSSQDGYFDFVQFHPSYTYEDFMRGLKPEIKDGSLTYNYAEGRFIQFCEKAQTEYQDLPCVFIIDEINRANISQVFGELMYLLEYRNAEITLSSGKTFTIPDNVLIIGTMNTADRSIALIDHALRRRFAFIKITPNYQSLRNKFRDSDFPIEKLIAVLEGLNQRICDAMGSKDYELGTSFFMTDNLSEEIEDIWQMEVEPYLEEYFFDNQSQEIIESFRWSNVKQQIY